MQIPGSKFIAAGVITIAYNTHIHNELASHGITIHPNPIPRGLPPEAPAEHRLMSLVSNSNSVNMRVSFMQEAGEEMEIELDTICAGTLSKWVESL